MRLDHSIFKGPLDPKLELGDTEVPESYRSYPGGKELGKTLKSWKVQSGKFPDAIDVGLVSGPWGFEDSPDAEKISSGINSKGPEAVAIGRHGNWFLWGFSGDPEQMTESGRRVFINAVCYMKNFDGLTPLAPKVSRSRDVLPVYIGFSRKYSSYLNGFPDDVRRMPGLSEEKLEAWRRENVESIRLEGSTFRIDTDVKALGVSNRKVEFFDAVLSRLAKDEKDELAWRAVRRYVPEPKFENVAELRAWVDENRARLFFSDVGGYRWFLNRIGK